MELLITVDPGVQGCGLALFDNKRLDFAAYIKKTNGQVAYNVADEINSLIKIDISAHDIVELVIEIPQIYDSAHQKGDQKDLVDLAVISGAIAGACRNSVTNMLFVRPAEWKGQTPKHITEIRARACLSSAEKRCTVLAAKAKTKAHNVWDAIALGLWRLKR